MWPLRPFLFISLCNHVSSCKYHVGLFYRPPSSGVQSLQSLCTYFESLDSSYFYNLVLLGDFNVDFYNQSHFLYPHLNSILDSFSLHQVMRVTHTSALLVMLHSLIWPWSLICHNFTSAQLCHLWRTLITQVWT